MKTRIILAAVAAAALSACGGGSDSGAPSATPAALSTKLSGTAAVGAALPNATVQAKCASGSGSATTAADGTFVINIPDAKRPCVLSVTTADDVTLHSVVEAGTSTNAVANITPLTELITASLAGGNTKAFFDSFDATAQSKLNADGLRGAIDAVKLILTGTVDLAGVDPLKDTLVAAHGSTPGNALDQRLDTLGAALASSKTSISDLSDAVASNKGSTDGIKTLLNPASATCASYRSGKYHKVDLTANTIQRFTVDAVALTRTNDATSASEQYAANAAEACRFGNTDARLLVSKSGIGLERRAGAASLLIPEQTIPLSELAGDWVAMSFERETNPGNYGSGLIQFNVDGAGKFTKAADCGMSGCGQPWPASDLPTFSANANGGFDLTDTSGTARAFGFKGVDGQLGIVIVHANGFMVARHPVARVLPVVGFTNAYWDAALDAAGVTDITTFSNTVIAVDAATRTYTRQRNDGRIDTWQDNAPFTGVRYRPLVAPVNGLPGAAESIGMSLSNTGLTVSINVNPTNPFYSISIDRP
ncbi:hypothetical protein [Cupriavidus pauculus]|uniref:Uncharacterized protein n=1 Tax=Cupriavidus pauculus TaxID=82633 RepID=A0A2N5CDH9_9BURK|nr:hypothetical protein [Cupriavidus pauculus]PLQ00248.1 hypothetical protein CYJ10_11335 [Cupriavidus pauculus]